MGLAPHLFTRLLMFDAVPYSVVNMLLYCDIWVPARQIERGTKERVRGCSTHEAG